MPISDRLPRPGARPNPGAAGTRSTGREDRLPPSASAASPAACERCGADLGGPAWQSFRICDACGWHGRRSARETIARLTDPGSFHEMDPRLASRDPLHFVDEVPYQERLEESRKRTGEADAIVTGIGTIEQYPVVLAVLDFNFLGGSMGVVVGEKLVRAAARAERDRRPLITIVASGGARMQEGMLSLLQMAKTVAAIKRLQARGQAFVSVLTNPTTGGVFASFGSLGDFILAEPGALIGFAGPRVAEQAIGRKLPPGSHTAEFLLAHGLIDAIVDRRQLRPRLADILAVLAAPRRGFNAAHPTAGTGQQPVPAAWEVVRSARALDRPTSLDYVRRMIDRFVPLRGDRAGTDDPAVVAGLGLLGGRAVAVVGLERGHDPDQQAHHGGRARPEGYRKAQRVMKLAARLGMPVVTLIDTPGAWPGPESEERGLAAELAASMALMSDLPTPTVSAVIGEGGSGGALALAVADCVLMQQNAVYSVIAPEGAATILFRDAGRAPELSERLKITAGDLKNLGLVDRIVPEPVGGAHADPDEAARLLRQAIEHALAGLSRRPPARLVEERWQRYQAIGRNHAQTLSRRRMPPRPTRRFEPAVPSAPRPGRRRLVPWRRTTPPAAATPEPPA